MSKKQIGIFLPPPVPQGESASVHTAGIGRLPAATQKRVWDLISQREQQGDIEIIRDLNFQDFHILNGKVFCKDFCVSDLDIYFWYSEINRKTGSYDLEVLKTLARTVKVVRDPVIYEQSLDKFLSLNKLRDAGLPVSETMLLSARGIGGAEKILKEWGSGILKPRRGGFGKGVVFIPDFASLRDTIEYAETQKESLGDFFLERYYDNDVSKWTSVTVVNGKVMYGFRKKPSRFVQMGKGMKVYDAGERGGETELCEITAEHAEYAIKAAEALTNDIVGFDMIWHDDRPIIVDVNTFPGYYEDVFASAGKDPAKEFFSIIEKYI